MPREHAAGGLSPHFQLVLNSRGAKVALLTNSQGLCDYFRHSPFVRHHIAEYSVNEGVPTRSPSGRDPQPSRFTIVVDDCSKACYVAYDRKIRTLSVTGRLGHDYDELTLTFNARQLFARAHQETGVFAVHAGAVKIDSGAVLLIGGERAGKSTSTAYLSANYGATWLCDKQALITINTAGTTDWAGGNTVITLREDAYEYLPHNTLDDITLPNFRRLPTMGDKLNLEIAGRDPELIPITHVVELRLSQGQSKLKSRNRESSIHRVYAEMSDDIHGHYGSFLNIKYAMPSLDTPHLRKRRLSTAIALGASARTLGYEGHLNYIGDLVAAIHGD